MEGGEGADCLQGATYSPVITHTRILTPVFIPFLPHWTRLATLCLPGQNAAPPLPGARIQAWWPEVTKDLGSEEGDTGRVPLRRAFGKGKPEEG